MSLTNFSYKCKCTHTVSLYIDCNNKEDQRFLCDYCRAEFLGRGSKCPYCGSSGAVFSEEHISSATCVHCRHIFNLDPEPEEQPLKITKKNVFKEYIINFIKTKKSQIIYDPEHTCMECKGNIFLIIDTNKKEVSAACADCNKQYRVKITNDC